MVPTTGHMKVTVTGADGGNTFDAFGGSGGRVVAVFDAVAGEVVRVIIGCPGSGGTTGGGGGGGTAVMKCGFNSAICNIGAATLLVVAGGGGGAARCLDTEFDEDIQEEVCVEDVEGGGASIFTGTGFGGNAEWPRGGSGGGGVLSAGVSNLSGTGGGQATFALISSGGIPATNSSGGAGGAGFGGGGAGDANSTGGGGGGGFSGGWGRDYEQAGYAIGDGGTNFVSNTARSVQTNIGGEAGGSGGDYSMGTVLIECISGAYGCDDIDIELTGEELGFGTHTYRAERNLTASNWLDIGADVELTAGESIRLLPGFRTFALSTLSARIVDCAAPEAAARSYGELVPVEVPNSAESLDFQVFPNPVADVLNYRLADMDQVERVLLVDLMGRVIHESESVIGYLNVQDIPPGVYLLVLETSNGRLQKRVVRP